MNYCNGHPPFKPSPEAETLKLTASARPPPAPAEPRQKPRPGRAGQPFPRPPRGASPRSSAQIRLQAPNASRCRRNEDIQLSFHPDFFSNRVILKYLPYHPFVPTPQPRRLLLPKTSVRGVPVPSRAESTGQASGALRRRAAPRGGGGSLPPGLASPS